MLNQAHCSKWKKGFGWVRVELWLDAMESHVRNGVRMLDGGTDKIYAIGAVLLQIENELGRENIGKRLEDGCSFLVYLLDGAFDFMTVGIWCCDTAVRTQYELPVTSPVHT